jgi:hypothetical protein
MKKEPPTVPSIETEVSGAVVYLPRSARLIQFGDDDDAASFDGWWQELGRIDYVGWTTRRREWKSKRGRGKR